jgi:hypothetical protein
MLVGVMDGNLGTYIENQVFGFHRSRRDLFKALYRRTINEIAAHGMNGYPTFWEFINGLKDIGIEKSKIIFNREYDGTHARHPGYDDTVESPTYESSA